jgi:hypothetical protein
LTRFDPTDDVVIQRDDPTGLTGGVIKAL